MEKLCKKCGMPLDDMNTCDCNDGLCIYCCECDADCECGCRRKKDEE